MTTSASDRASTAKKPATKADKPAKRKPGAPTGAKVEKVNGERQTVRRPAPKAPAKAPAAPAKKATPAKAKAPQSGEFGVVPGSLQEKLLAVLRKHLNEPVALSTLLVAVYGPKEAKTKSGAIGMVIGGVKVKAQAHGHDIVRGRYETGPTVALVKVGKAGKR